MTKNKHIFPSLSYKKLYSISIKRVRHAVHFFNMLEPNDKVIIGISGGMDSLALLDLFANPKNNWMKQIEVIPLHIASGYDNDPKEIQSMKDYCEKLGHPLRVEYRDIQSKAFSREKRFNPCFVCSRMRRKAIFETAENMGVTKIALGHHKDDLLETFFINMLFGRELATLMPKQSLFKGLYHIIRPLFLLEKRHVQGLLAKRPFPILSRACPMDGHSKRDYVEKFLNNLYKDDPKVKQNIFRSLFHVNNEYLLEEYSELLKQI